MTDKKAKISPAGRNDRQKSSACSVFSVSTTNGQHLGKNLQLLSVLVFPRQGRSR
jgi:hypothetical protein